MDQVRRGENDDAVPQREKVVHPAQVFVGGVLAGDVVVGRH